jgi:uncharacterized secreted protein with C-terminal beta-propeller domain
MFGPDTSRTSIHRFSIEDPERAVYTGSGGVEGRLLNQWAMSEHRGHLRVATTTDGRQSSQSSVVVLDTDGPDLDEVGRVDGLGITEQIYAVRYLGDLGYVVTFRQTDPLYVVDLSDPRAPAVLGELKIPGFSSYLHPVGGDLLVGLGQDATMRGRTRGAQAAVFDLADLAHPRRVDTEGFGRSTEFAAAWDPRAFTYLPEQRTAFAVLGDWSRGDRVVVLGVGEDGRLTRRGSHHVPGWSPDRVRTLPLADGRVAIVGGGTVELVES